MRQSYLLPVLRIALLLGFLMNTPKGVCAAQLIGLLTLPTIFHSEGCHHEEVAIYADPNTNKRIGSIRVDEDSTSIAGLAQVYRTSGDKSDFPTLEYRYEVPPAAVVLEQRDLWFKVLLSDGEGWIQSSKHGKYLPLETLFKDQMTYLTVYFNGQLSSAPRPNTSASDNDDVKSGFTTIAAIRAPRSPGEPIGLLRLSDIFFTPKCDGVKPEEEIAIYADSTSNKRIGSIRCMFGYPQVNIAYDEFNRVTTQLPTLRTARQSTGYQSVIGIPVLELEYEAKTAIVLERRDQWLKVSLGPSSDAGWIESSERNKFFPLETLLPDDRLNDLLSVAPGATIPAPYDVVDYRPVRILNSRRMNGQLWFNVEVLSHEKFDRSNEEPVVIGKGWLSAHNATGHPTIWFYSRGY